MSTQNLTYNPNHKPLYNFSSQENSYLVSSYPYGRLRCKIWFWLEHNEKLGYRFCSVTENPKTFRINAPKKSTYSFLAGCMYLDENDHVQWSGLGPYSSAEECLHFVRMFPNANLEALKPWALLKIGSCNKVLAAGKAYGRELTALDIVRYNNEIKVWRNVLECALNPISHSYASKYESAIANFLSWVNKLVKA